MTSQAACPVFDEAIRRFQDFLHSQGWPTALRWATVHDLVRVEGQPLAVLDQDQTGRLKDAARMYETGRQRGRGVLLDAVCTLGDATCAVVEFPVDDDEAQRLMFPADGGLKLSVAQPRTEGVVRWPVC